jgi:hypothetical protein
MTLVGKKILEKNKATRDSQEVEVAVVRPNHRQMEEGQQVHNAAFRKGLESGAILRARVEHYLREQKLWDDAKQAEFDRIQKVLLDGEKTLKRGRIKLGEARKVAIGMAKARTELLVLNAERVRLDNNTVEAQAENARFNFYVSACTVYADTGKPVFRNLQDYLERAGEDLSWEAASALASLLNNYDADAEKKLPENAFLLKYKFVDDKLRYVNKDGHLTDVDGKLIDEDGRFVAYVDGQKVFVDREGNRVDDKGEYVVEDAGPFLDDETGEPLA